MALFYVFANLLLSGLTETAQFSYLFVHSICCDILFWSKHMRKVSLTLVYSWKGRRSWTVFSTNGGYSSLIRHPNSTTDNFLKSRGQCSFWKPVDELFMLCSSKSTTLSCRLNEIFYLCTIWEHLHTSRGKHGFTEVWRSSKWRHCTHNHTHLADQKGF